MKNRIILTIFFLLMIVVTSCGKRTAPVPIARSVSETGVSQIQNLSTRYKGSDLELQWALSNTPQLASPKRPGQIQPSDLLITRFEIRFEKRNATCVECSSVRLASLIIDLKSGDIQLQRQPEAAAFLTVDSDLSLFHFQIADAGNFKLFISTQLFKPSFFTANCGFTIRYYTGNRPSATHSDFQGPDEIPTIPKPVIRVKKLTRVYSSSKPDIIHLINEKILRTLIEGDEWRPETAQPGFEGNRNGIPYQNSWLPLMPGGKTESNYYLSENRFSAFTNQCERPVISYDLFLDWRPTLEGISHVIKDGSGVTETPIMYGVNLYALKENESMSDSEKNDTFHTAVPLNKTPLRYGKYHLHNLNRPLIARHVDRHNNESALFFVFNGKYDE